MNGRGTRQATSTRWNAGGSAKIATRLNSGHRDGRGGAGSGASDRG